MNYKKLIEDFNSGKLDRNKVKLVIDKKYGESNGYNDIVNVLVAAGVNCEWC